MASPCWPPPATPPTRAGPSTVAALAALPCLVKSNLSKLGNEGNFEKVKMDKQTHRHTHTHTMFVFILVGTRDGRTQSARACKLALLHLALRTWVSGPRLMNTGFQDLDKRTLSFKTSINEHWVSGLRQTHALSGLGFQDLDGRTHFQDLGFRTSTDARTLRTWVLGPRQTQAQI